LLWLTVHGDTIKGRRKLYNRRVRVHLTQIVRVHTKGCIVADHRFDDHNLWRLLTEMLRFDTVMRLCGNSAYAFAAVRLTLLVTTGEALGCGRHCKTDTAKRYTHSLFRWGRMFYDSRPCSKSGLFSPTVSAQYGI
jgi:hypothetical protein